MATPLGRIAAACIVAGVVSAAVCGADGADRRTTGDEKREAPERAAAEREYRVLMTELRLAEGGGPYLVIDVPRSRLLIKLHGAVVWEYPVEPESGSDGLEAFAERFAGDDGRVIRAVRGTHLYSFSEKTPDSVLAIVSEVVHAETDLMQRIVPGRFNVTWKGGVILEVRTDEPGRPKSRVGNVLEGIRRSIWRRRPGARLVTRMDADRALTLFRVARRGLPTLIYMK